MLEKSRKIINVLGNVKVLKMLLSMNIIETAKANGLDAYAYLNYVLTQLPIYQAEKKDIEELLPWNVEL